MKPSSCSKPNPLLGFRIFHKSENFSQIATESWINKLVQGAFHRHACGFFPLKTCMYLQTRGLHQPRPAAFRPELWRRLPSLCLVTSSPGARPTRICCFAARRQEKGRTDPFGQPTWFRAESKAGGQTHLPSRSEDVGGDPSIGCRCPLIDSVTAPRSSPLPSEPNTYVS